MAKLHRLMGKNRDVTLGAQIRIPSAAAAGANDYEMVVFTVPDLTKIAPTVSGTAGFVPQNAAYVRSIMLTPEAAITGAATNFFAWNVRQYRAGSLVALINTTSATTITAGSGVVVTPASMAGIQVGTILYFSGGTGTAEYVIVTAVTATTLTATFANNHSGAYTIVSNNIASVAYSGTGVTEAAYTTHQSGVGAFTIPTPHKLIAGDVLTLARQTFGTGLSGGSPALTVMIDYGAVVGSPLGSPAFWG